MYRAINDENFVKYSPLWKKIYKHRRKKVSKRLATYSANAVVFSEALKEHISDKSNLFDKVYKKFLAEEEKVYDSKKKKKKYKIRKVGSYSIIITTNEKTLNDFPNAIKKGIIRNATDEFTQEMLFKVRDKYDIKLHPDLYYIIYREEEL